LPPIADTLMFHVVTEGRCWLEVEGADARLLEQGGFALVPHGRGHRLASELGSGGVDLFETPREQVSERYEILRLGGGGARSTVICVVVRFDHPAALQLTKLLPPAITVESWRSSQRDWVQSTTRFIADEAKSLRPGGETVITRLADILVIQAIRSWLEQDPLAKKGWLGALQDAQIGRALALIHREPSRPWTVAALAAEATMSRSAFAARFTALVGEPVMHYVARWRMQVAMDALKDDGVAGVALRLGYQSEAAFSRAFRRFTGITPGAVRRTASEHGRQPATSGVR
jgi:AraC-like DNA-binding protein